MMLVDKDSRVHLYIQIANSIRGRIESGEFPSGSVLPTEAELCKVYGVSRFPMRQAMSILTNEGYLSRTRGSGTFVNEPGKVKSCGEAPGDRGQTIALIIPAIDSDFAQDIVIGFERVTAEHGYTMFLAISSDLEREIDCIERVSRCGAAGIVLFPSDKTYVNEEALDELISDGIYVSIIDRNPGLDHIDYVGSDNSGGGFLAARHMKLQGLESAVFISGSPHVSSVAERFAGFRKGLQQYRLTLLNDLLQEGNATRCDDYSTDSFIKNIEWFRARLPFGIFAENDPLAFQLYDILGNCGMEIGRDVGIIGFDNMQKGKYMSPPLTSIAQNGILIGEAAATQAIQKIETGSKQSVRHILPVQLIARKSCCEDRQWR